MSSKKIMTKKKGEEKVVKEDQEDESKNPEAVAAALADLEAIENERIGLDKDTSFDEDEYVNDDGPAEMPY